MRKRERTAWILVAVEGTAIVAIAYLWQTDRGWDSLSIGSGTELLSAIVAGALLITTLSLARRDRIARDKAELAAKRHAEFADAEAVAIWPVRERTKLGEPLGWAVALQNMSRAALVSWQLTVDQPGNTARWTFSSEEHGGLHPQSASPLLLALRGLAISDNAPEFSLRLSWTDGYGRRWSRHDDKLSRVDGESR